MFIISLVSICWSAESAFRLGGYLQNRTRVIMSDSKIISDHADARIEGYWNYGRRAGIELHLLASSALQPIDPFANVRPGSVMADALQSLSNTFMSRMDTSLLSLVEGMGHAGATDFLPYSSLYPHTSITLDRALLKYFFPACDVYIGRQTIAWGTGYAFNPTDIWNRKNPLDPDAPRQGVNAVRAEIPFGALSGISLVVSPGPDPDHTGAGFRLNTYTAGFDMSVCVTRTHTADHELLNLPEKMCAGMDCAGQIDMVGIWGEAALCNPVFSGNSYTDFDSLYAQIDAGADYTFENGVYVMAEYLYNGLGEPDADAYDMQEMRYILAGDMSGFGRHYVMAGTEKTFADFYAPSFFVLVNASDGSAMLLPSFSYTFSDNLIVEVSAQLGIAESKKSEFGSIYPNIGLTAKGYF
jgi:hypothetical protein